MHRLIVIARLFPLQRNYCRSINFDNTKIAYGNKSMTDLLRDFIIMKTFSFNWLIKHHQRILTFTRCILGDRLFKYVMKITFYRQFVAGEVEREVADVIGKMRKGSVRSIIDYAAEGDVVNASSGSLIRRSTCNMIVPKDNKSIFPESAESFLSNVDQRFSEYEDQFNKNLETTLRSIELAETTSKPERGYIALKLTSLGRPELLLHLSKILIQMEDLFENILCSDVSIKTKEYKLVGIDSFRESLQKFCVGLDSDSQLQWFSLIDRNGDGFIDMFEWLNLIFYDRNIFHTFKLENKTTKERLPAFADELTDEGRESLRLLANRLYTVVKLAKQKNVVIMIDAEQTYMQPAIRRFTLELMKMYNRDSIVVCNTYQCYLKTTMDHVLADLHFSAKHDFKIGLKLVRGAYMDQEREKAKREGYEDPINANFEETSKIYDSCLDLVLREVKRRPKDVELVVATHNEESIRKALIKMDDLIIPNNSESVAFAQLYGMCDHITFSLGLKGYLTYKYLPYGPVDEVLPYLSRRALENNSIFDKVDQQRKLLRKEIFRRLSFN